MVKKLLVLTIVLALLTSLLEIVNVSAETSGIYTYSVSNGEANKKPL